MELRVEESQPVVEMRKLPAHRLTRVCRDIAPDSSPIPNPTFPLANPRPAPNIRREWLKCRSFPMTFHTTFLDACASKNSCFDHIFRSEH